jgi:hypothetical protein
MFELGSLRIQNRTVELPHKSLKMAKKFVLKTLISTPIVVGACECAFKPRPRFDKVLILIWNVYADTLFTGSGESFNECQYSSHT